MTAAEGALSLPRYRCHKEVRALKIARVEFPMGQASGALLVPVDEGYAPFRVDADYLWKYDPQPGGYYVVYKDGYASFSPADAFEDGYTRI